jgi:hypothetical protein
MSDMMYKQVKNGFDNNIKLNESTISITRKALVDDGNGNLVPNPYDSSPTVVSRKCRLSHERNNPEPLGEVPSGFDSGLYRMILWSTDQDIQENDRFDDYRVGPVDSLSIYGKVYGYQASLEVAR